MTELTKKPAMPTWVIVNWVIIALPAAFMLAWDASSNERVDFIRYSGLVCTWFLLLSLAVTGLLQLLPAGNYRPYLRKNRRYLGVAAFFYTVLHLAWYVKEVRDIGKILKTFVRPDMVTGWIALAIMAVLAWTSFDSSVKKLGPQWKKLHLWTYPAAALSYAHWAMAGHKIVEPLLYFLPIIALRLYARRA